MPAALEASVPRVETLLALVLCAGTAGCSLAPAYAPPAPPQVTAFKEDKGWTQAQPADALPRGGWWKVFNDPVLDGLEQKVDAANPTLAQALARYQAAQGFLGIAQSAEGPRLGANGSFTRNRQSDNRPLRGSNQPDEYAANTIGVQLDYEIDLWGRVRNEVAAQKANVQASAADLASAKLSLETQLASDYVQLRGLDAQADLLAQTVTAYEKTDDLIGKRHTDGLASKLDVDRSRTLLETARAQASEVASRRALLEHAIASLAGETASTFGLPPQPQAVAAPNTPPAVPSQLLQRRPDVAAAERRMAAANAEIGVARAAFFPVLSIDGVAGFQNTGGPNLLSAPNSYWGIGPQLLFTIFDAGRRHAQEDVAKAQYDQAAAAYRGQVLQAFQDVEDALALENKLAAEAVDQGQAVQAAEEAQAIALKRFHRGVISYLDVITAQTAALQAEQAAVDLAARRSAASIRLVQAIGGGWEAPGSVVESR
jgi:NodT family efflux transporter outer membrane factor (OMF) lipoprotein